MAGDDGATRVGGKADAAQVIAVEEVEDAGRRRGVLPHRDKFAAGRVVRFGDALRAGDLDFNRAGVSRGDDADLNLHDAIAVAICFGPCVVARYQVC